MTCLRLQSCNPTLQLQVHRLPGIVGVHSIPAGEDGNSGKPYITVHLSCIQVSLTGGFVRGAQDDFKATVIGFDEDKDIAVLKIDVPDKKVGGSTHVRTTLPVTLPAREQPHAPHMRSPVQLFAPV